MTRALVLAATLGAACSSAAPPAPIDGAAGPVMPEAGGSRPEPALDAATPRDAASETSPQDAGSERVAADAATPRDAASEISPQDAPRGPDGGSRGLAGGVVVDLVEDHTAFLGLFFDGPLPPGLLDLSQEQGSCKLMVPRAVSCEPACAQGFACTGVNRCAAKPNAVNVGVLKVRGLGVGDREAEPTSPTVLSYQLVPTLPPTACREGDAVQVAADSFGVTGQCVAPLVLTSAAPIPVVSGQPMRLVWIPPGRPGLSRIQIELDISHHGGFKGQIECDVPDTGAFDIPEPLITALVNLGRAGYPTVKVFRTSIATSPTEPQVRLVIQSLVEREVDTGVISCGVDPSPPCPQGTECRGDFTCR